MEIENIVNAETLDKAIAEQELQVKILEQELDKSVEYLQQHFVTMMLRSMIPKSAIETGITEILNNEKLKDGVSRLVNTVTDFTNKFRKKQE
jgi:hypothetical protein